MAISDRSTGTSRVLTEPFRNLVDAFQWTSDSKSLYFGAPVEGDNLIFRVTLESGSIHQVLVDRTIDSFELSPDNRRIIYTRRSVSDPVEIFAVDLAESKPLTPGRLSQFNDEVANEVDLRPAERMWVTGAEGAEIEVFVVKSHDFDPSKKYPLILNVHGGPQFPWQDAFRGDWQVYPSVGYVVAFACPHGSTGYRQDFTAEISGDHGGQVLKTADMSSSVTYGGYITKRYKAIASMMSLFDLCSVYGAAEGLWFPEWDLKGQPGDSDQYEKFSPSYFVKNFKTPCLVISAERDYPVPYTQSLQMITLS